MSRRVEWTEENLIVLRRLYGRFPAKSIAAIVNLPVASVQWMASSLGLTKTARAHAFGGGR